MPTHRIRASILAALVLLSSSPAHADVDITGRWFIAAGFGSDCNDLVQTGSHLDGQRCDGFAFPWTGTIDPVTGAFTWEQDSATRVVATAAPDGSTFVGTIFVHHCTFVGCTELSFSYFGSRCRGGIVDPGEDCDVGPNTMGTCCTNDCRFADAGTLCDTDADPETDEACDPDGACLSVPPPTCDPCLVWDPDAETCVPDVRRDCRRPIAPAARMSMSTTTPDARDALSFAWSRGAATTSAELGDPRAATAYELCVFADAGATLLLSSTVPAGGTCGTRPCWSTNGGNTTFRYRNPHGDGIRSVKLTSGAAGDATIRLGGKGPALGLPTTLDPSQPPVTVQLRRTDAPICWEARFPVLRTNTTSRLRARAGQ